MERTDNSGAKTPREGRGSRVFTLVVLALLLLAILAAIFVPLGIYRSRGKVMISYGSLTVRQDLYVYWLSAYKYAYLTAQSKNDPTAAADTPRYWNETVDGGITRAEKVRAAADAWIKWIVFAAASFEDEDDALGQGTRNELEATCERLLQYELKTEKAFNRAAKQVGFTYSTVKRAYFYQTEGESYLLGVTDEEWEIFCTLAESEITIKAAAAKVDFASLPIDARLYNAAFLPET